MQKKLRISCIFNKFYVYNILRTGMGCKKEKLPDQRVEISHQVRCVHLLRNLCNQFNLRY